MNRIIGIQYGVRNRKLKELGFNSYDEYLRSDNWKAIKARIDKKIAAGKTFWRICFICGSPRNIHIHHYSYGKIKKITLARMYPLCATHHLMVHEYTKAHAVSLKQAISRVKRDFRRSFSLESQAMIDKLKKKDSTAPLL